MKKIILFFVTFFYLSNLYAVDLTDALSLAYKKNPELNAERENIKVSKQELNISKSDFLPSVTRTLDNSNLPRSRNNFRFPSGHSLYILPSITRTTSVNA